MVNSRSDCYQLFLDSIRSPATLRRYKNLLYHFLKLVPNQIYLDYIGKTPDNDKVQTLAKFFVDLARKDMDLASDIIATFIKEDRKRVTKGEISSQTIPNHIKPIKVLLDANRIPIHWKSLNKLLPRRESKSKDRAYTKEEIQKMLKTRSGIVDEVIILMFSSAGFRLEAWDYFTWKDVIFFENEDGTYKGAALQVYRGDPESYFTFITPEACQALQQYKENWKADIGEYPKPDDPLIKSTRYPVVRRLNQKGIRKRIERIVTDIGLRPSLPPGQRRHEVQLDHGFRKYFNTMLRRAKVNYLDKEDMMGHKIGLEKHYERYEEADFERFPEYQKAIPFLTVSAAAQKQIELEKVSTEFTNWKKGMEKKMEKMVEQKFTELRNLKIKN